MDYLFYRTTDLDFIGKLQCMRNKQVAYRENIEEIIKEVGAFDWAQYRTGSVAFFHFKQEPDRKVWKKSHEGFLPKVSNKEGKAIAERIKSVPTPKPLDDILKDYQFPMMVLGESTSRGIAVHNSTLFGKFSENTFFVRVPKGKGCDFTPPDIFTEVKEWEALKFMDEGAVQ